MKTPTAQLAENGGSQHPEKRKMGGHGPTLADEIEHLLPTPVTTDAEQARRGTTTTGRSHSGTSLTDALLPTPMSSEGDRGSHAYSRGNPTLIGALLPTPSASLLNDGEDPEQWLDRFEKHATKTDELPTRAGMPLAISAKLLASGDLSRLRYAAGRTSSDE